MQKKTVEAIRKMVFDFSEEISTPPHRTEQAGRKAWSDLNGCGTRLWLDSGDIEQVAETWDPAFEALTTNNTLLSKEVQKGVYDEYITRIADRILDLEPRMKARELILEIHFVLNAVHSLRMARMFDVHVSVELHTDVANEVERSVDYGLRYHAVCPDRFYVKVPFTPAGLLAARRLRQHEVPVNLTLGFSVRQNYLAARLAEPEFVNVFLGRLNSFVDESGLGSGENTGEKTTLATQKMLRNLRETGQIPSHLIGASIRGPSQVETLAGVDVLTIPPAVAAEYAENPPNKLHRSLKDDQAFHVSMRPGYTSSDFNGQSLWDLAEPVHCAVANLMAKDLDAMTPDGMLQHFENEKVPDFMPVWSLEEIDTLVNDGKIPPYEKWSDRLTSGTLGLDALMNMSALCSFVEDQRKLDQHIETKLEIQPS